MLTSDDQRWLRDFKLFNHAKQAKTFFDIGARGYYENSMTDILAFYLNPNEAHGLNTLILETFLKFIERDINDSLELSSECESYTQFPENVDLLLVGTDWVITIKNKVWHTPENPFQKYEMAVRQRYQDKRKHHFLLLAPYRPSNTPPGWVWIDTRKLFAKFQNKLKMTASNSANKWIVFLEDFIQNIINMTTIDQGWKMEQDQLQDVASQIDLLVKAKDLYEEYHNSLKLIIPKSIAEVLPNFTGTARFANWEALGKAIRVKLYPNEDFDITFLTIPSGSGNTIRDERMKFRFVVQYHMTCTEKPVDDYPADMKASNFSFLRPSEQGGRLFWFWAGTNEYPAALDLVRQAATKIGEYRASASKS